MLRGTGGLQAWAAPIQGVRWGPGSSQAPMRAGPACQVCPLPAASVPALYEAVLRSGA